MYVPAQNACTMQSGETPVSPAQIAAAQTVNAEADAAVIAANSNWQSIVARNWQSFANLGPYVALQLRNLAPTSDLVASASTAVPDSTDTSVAPVGVSLVAQGNPTGSNPAAGGSGGAVAPGPVSIFGQPVGGRRRRRSGNPAVDAAQQFVGTFGPPPVMTYTGPSPEPGSVLSMVYGGAGRSLPVGPGVYAAFTPDQRYGYAANCPNPSGVSMLPVGEPSYLGASDAVGSSASGVGISLLALLGLAGAVYLADRSDKKRGKRS